MKKITYLLILVLAISLTGCRSSRKGTANSVASTEARASYEAAVEQYFSFDYLQCKLKYTLEGKSFNGKLFVEQGKSLAMTVTVPLLGEMARVEANQQEVYISEKLDKAYVHLSIPEMAAKLGMEDEACYEALEALILGRIYIPGKGYATKKDFDSLVWDNSAEDGSVTGTYQGKGYLLHYTLNADHVLSSTQVEVPEKGATFTWNYSDRLAVEGKGNIPGQEILEVDATGKNISLQLNVSSPQLSKSGWKSLKINGYSEMSFEELVKLLKNL